MLDSLTPDDDGADDIASLMATAGDVYKDARREQGSGREVKIRFWRHLRKTRPT